MTRRSVVYEKETIAYLNAGCFQGGGDSAVRTMVNGVLSFGGYGVARSVCPPKERAK